MFGRSLQIKRQGPTKTRHTLAGIGDFGPCRFRAASRPATLQTAGEDELCGVYSGWLAALNRAPDNHRKQVSHVAGSNARCRTINGNLSGSSVGRAARTIATLVRPRNERNEIPCAPRGCCAYIVDIGGLDVRCVHTASGATFDVGHFRHSRFKICFDHATAKLDWNEGGLHSSSIAGSIEVASVDTNVPSASTPTPCSYGKFRWPGKAVANSARKLRLPHSM